MDMRGTRNASLITDAIYVTTWSATTVKDVLLNMALHIIRAKQSTAKENEVIFIK